MARPKKIKEEPQAKQMTITEMIRAEQAEQIARMEAKLKAEREAKERAEREAAEREAKERAERAEREAAEAVESERRAKVEAEARAEQAKRNRAYKIARLEKTYCILSGLKICMDNAVKAYKDDLVTCGALFDKREFQEVHSEIGSYIFFIKKDLLEA